MKDPLIGQYLGNYRIDSVIGRGGMAMVYYGWDENLHRPVAVKVIDARYRDDPAYTERFVQEARAVAAWRHENILQVYYAGQQDDLYYFAMEYVDGPDLSRLMKQYVGEGELIPQEDVLKIGWAVARALDYAHKRDVVHRDVKPSNIMIGKDGRVTLADFGLALNAQQGSFGGTFGTPHYIAPEQARNSAMAVPQSDLYALGVILYEMLTGSVPFNDPSPTTLAIQHLTLPPPPPRQLNPRLNEAVDKVLLKALSKQSADRYQSGTELMEALAAALNMSETAVPPMSSVAMPVLSQMSVVERVSLYMPPPPSAVQGSSTPTPQLASTPTLEPSLPAPSAPPPRRFRGIQLFVAGIVVLCLLMAVGWALFGNDMSGAIAALFAAPSPASTAIDEEQPTESPIETTVLPTETGATLEATGTEPDVSTSTTMEPTAVSDEQQPTAQPTDIPVQESTSPLPTETIAALPTAIPDGLRLVMLYNSTSFYVYNPDGETRIRTSQLNFESLDENGQFSGYMFEGVRWAQFYSFLNPLNCVRLEVPPTGWLRPSQCRAYNATVTPEEDGSLIFWTPRTNVAAFRVLWDGEEVGRCDVTSDQCEVFLP